MLLKILKLIITVCCIGGMAKGVGLLFLVHRLWDHLRHLLIVLKIILKHVILIVLKIILMNIWIWILIRIIVEILIYSGLISHTWLCKHFIHFFRKHVLSVFSIIYLLNITMSNVHVRLTNLLIWLHLFLFRSRIH